MPAPRDFAQIITELIRRVALLEQKASLAGTGLALIDLEQIMQSGSITIPDNGLLLVDGGDVVLLNEDLVEVLRFGVMEHGDRGLVLRRADGTIALEMRKPFGPSDEQQVFFIRDRTGALIGGDALLSPTGFDAPHLELRFIPVDYANSDNAQTTASATFAPTHEHRGFRQNPALRPLFMVQCSDATTAAEIQVWDVIGGAYLGGFLSLPLVHTIAVPAGTTTWTEVSLPVGEVMALPGSMSNDMHLQIHARVTAGTGTVTVAPVRTIATGF